MLLRLGLDDMAEALEAQNRVPDIAELSFEDRLAMLLDREMTRRTERSYQARLRHADLALRKADKRERDRRLTAPVDGKIQQLSVSTIGGVVHPGETLMVVVPETDELEIQAHVLNRDKGFVRPGQPVVVKLDAFPFTKYGYVEGVVLDLSGDAVDDEALGPVYLARVGLGVTSIVVDGVAMKLEPGMSGAVEIRTGEQRIIDYLFSPLVRYQDEALRER